MAVWRFGRPKIRDTPRTRRFLGDVSPGTIAPVRCVFPLGPPPQTGFPVFRSRFAGRLFAIMWGYRQAPFQSPGFFCPADVWRWVRGDGNT